MYNEEKLEIHFWDWKKYNNKYVSDYIKYMFINNKNLKECIIDYIEIDKKEISNNIYENKITLSKKFNNYNDNINLLIKNTFITRIKFNYIDNIESYFYVNYSWKNFYYSIEFYVEDLAIKEIFENIKEYYIDLINIFNPLISNSWFEILWEDIHRIKNEKYFEWIFWYLSDKYKINYIKMNECIKLNNGILFINSFN